MLYVVMVECLVRVECVIGVCGLRLVMVEFVIGEGGVRLVRVECVIGEGRM